MRPSDRSAWPPDRRQGRWFRNEALASCAWALAAGLALGLALALGWLGRWPAALVLAASGTAAAVVLVRRSAAHARADAQRQRSFEERQYQLERQATQLEEAQKLVSLGSYDWNPASGELIWSDQHYVQWGHTPGSVRPDVDLFLSGVHPEDRDRVHEALQRALRGEAGYDCRHRVRRADGSVLHVHGRGKVDFDAQGQARRMIGTVLDITERVEAESALRLQGFVLDTLPDPISALDGATRRYRLVNRAWREITDLTVEQALARSFDEIFPSVHVPRRRQALDDCLSRGSLSTVRGAMPPARRPGLVLDTRFLPFRDPQLDWSGAVMVSRDVTEEEAARARQAALVDQLSLTLNTIGDAIFATEASGPDEPVLFANDPLRQMWRIPASLDRPLSARIILEHARPFFRDPEAELSRIEQIIAGEGDAEHRLELNDGRVLLRRCRRTRREGRQMRVWAFRDITAEVTAVRTLAAAEAQQRSLLGAYPGYIWVLDARHQVVYLNAAAARFHRPRQIRPPVSLLELIDADRYASLRPSIDRALAGEAQSFEWERKPSHDWEISHLLIKLAPGISATGERLCYAFGVDISPLKMAEAASTAARDAAERASRAKTQFLANMSHELRTPLNAIIGLSQVLEMDHTGALDARQRRHVGNIRGAGERLLALVGDLLDLARVESDPSALALAPVSLAELAQECLQRVRSTTPRSVTIELLPSPEDATVMADRRRLGQVLVQVLANACRHSRGEGRVELGWIEDGAQHWRIQVVDHGPDLDEAARTSLFEPLATASPQEGSGIGMALARSLVLAMRGSIGVDSGADDGSCVWMRLAAAPEVAPGKPSPGDTKQVFCVDDNPINLALLEALFDDLPGWSIECCSRPTSALERIRATHPDLVLLDLAMPGLDGWQIHEHIRADPSLRELPIIVVSADVAPETIERCRRAGFADFVPKPVDLAQLLDAAHRALARTAPTS